MCVHVYVHALLHLALCNPMDCIPPSSLSMEFSRQEYWSGLPFPTPGDVPDPGIKPIFLGSPALASRFFITVPPGKSKQILPCNYS